MAVRKVNGGIALALGVPLGAIGAALMKHSSFGLTPFYPCRFFPVYAYLLQCEMWKDL